MCPAFSAYGKIDQRQKRAQRLPNPTLDSLMRTQLQGNGNTRSQPSGRPTREQTMVEDDDYDSEDEPGQKRKRALREIKQIREPFTGRVNVK